MINQAMDNYITTIEQAQKDYETITKQKAYKATIASAERDCGALMKAATMLQKEIKLISWHYRQTH